VVFTAIEAVPGGIHRQEEGADRHGLDCGGVHRNRGRAGRLLLLADEFRPQAGLAHEIPCGCTCCVLTDGADKESRDAGAGGGHGLVETLAAAAGAQVSQHRVAWARKILHVKGEILDVTADDDDACTHAG